MFVTGIISYKYSIGIRANAAPAPLPCYPPARLRGCSRQEARMYAVIRKFNRMRNVEEAGRRVEAGLVSMMRQAQGFRGYYVVNGGGTVGCSISLFDNQTN